MAYPLRTTELGNRRFSLRENAIEGAAKGTPLIVALHGGSYSSAYFDVPGFSLLQRAESLGFSAAAIDRPGYGQSDVGTAEDKSHAGNAEILGTAIGALAERHAERCPGAVLIGHSIGGAIAVGIAARKPKWLLGIAVSGVGLENAPGDREAWESLPKIPFIEFPPEMKDTKMFGPPGTYEPDAPARSHTADAPAPLQELLDIVTVWPRDARKLLGQVAVPVHYRQAEHDALWQVNAEEVERFAAACSSRDAAVVPNSGHCIDFHKPGAAFQREQLDFALTCAAKFAS
jgi:pimeloyl-ACP methyl ester carboxylesterase